MTTEQLAARLIELCRDGKFKEAQDELYAVDAASVEPEGSHWPSVKGIEHLNAKVAQWNDMVEEVHGLGVSDPTIAGPFFSVRMTFDLTLKGGISQKGDQIAVYKVKDGKIVLEHFFYELPG